MASSSATFWAPGTTIRLGSLEFAFTIEEMLVRIEPPAPTPPPAVSALSEVATQSRREVAFTTPELRSDEQWHRMDASLGAEPTKEDLCRVLFAFMNVQGQLAGDEPLSPKLLRVRTVTNYPHDLLNAAHHARVAMTREMFATTVANDMFVGIIEQLSESFFDLLDQGSDPSSDSESDEGDSHPSRECHMVPLAPVAVPDRVEPENPVADAPEGAAPEGASLELPPGVAQDQLHARARELGEVRRELLAEQATIEREL